MKIRQTPARDSQFAVAESYEREVLNKSFIPLAASPVPPKDEAFPCA